MSRQRPAECAEGCPPQTVCDYCQGSDGKDSPVVSGAVDSCRSCDDTGDVHGLDGEYRGRCSCAYGEATPTPPVDDERFPQPRSKMWQLSTRIGELTEQITTITADHARIVAELQADAAWKSEVIKALLPYQDRAVAAEQRVEAMAGLLRELLNARPLLLYGDAWIDRINGVLTGQATPEDS